MLIVDMCHSSLDWAARQSCQHGHYVQCALFVVLWLLWQNLFTWSLSLWDLLAIQFCVVKLPHWEGNGIKVHTTRYCAVFQLVKLRNIWWTGRQPCYVNFEYLFEQSIFSLNSWKEYSNVVTYKTTLNLGEEFNIPVLMSGTYCVCYTYKSKLQAFKMFQFLAWLCVCLWCWLKGYMYLKKLLAATVTKYWWYELEL